MDEMVALQRKDMNVTKLRDLCARCGCMFLTRSQAPHHRSQCVSPKHAPFARLAVQGLQQEVARRQMAVLDRTSKSLDLPQTMHERQASLRCGHRLRHLLI